MIWLEGTDAVSSRIISYIDVIMIIPEAEKEARTNLNSMVTCKTNRCLLINLTKDPNGNSYE